MTVRETVDALTERLAPLDHAASVAWWDASTDVSDAHEQARIDADLAVRDALADPAVFTELVEAGDADDPLLAREIAVLRDMMTAQQVPAARREEIVRLEASIDATFNAYRAELDGAPVDDNVIAEILRTSPDVAARRAAWEASKEVGAEVAERVRHLAHLRNQAACELGFRDHFAMALATGELDEEALLLTLDEIDRATAEPFRAWKDLDDRLRAERFDITPAELRPWHYDDPFFQSAPAEEDLALDGWLAERDLVELTRATYRGIGLDIDPLLARSDLVPRDGKSQHAFCINIDRAADVRVLCNNVPGEYWAETMLHEFGHAVYDAGLDASLPWALRTMHPLTTEGVAMLFGRLILDPEWLREVAGMPDAAVDDAMPALARRRLVALLVFARWVLVMTNFERGLYADPDADHDARWWELVERYQLLTRPEQRQAPDWAAKIHVALAPVYYQNYLLGELVASQLQATLRRECGGIVGRPAAGRLLGERMFAPGWSRRWDELIVDATGTPLTVDAFAAELHELGSSAR